MSNNQIKRLGFRGQPRPIDDVRNRRAGRWGNANDFGPEFHFENGVLRIDVSVLGLATSEEIAATNARLDAVESALKALEATE